MKDINFKFEFNLQKELAESITAIIKLSEDIRKIQRDIRAIKKRLKMKDE